MCSNDDLLPTSARKPSKDLNMSIPKVNIQEANSHLRQLHKKVFELENKIQMQALHVEELQKANLQLQRQLKKITKDNAEEIRGKDSFISELTQSLKESEHHVQQLLEASHERDTAVLKLEKKARLFYEVVEHRQSIARILEVLNELSVEDEEEGSDKDVDPDTTGSPEDAGDGVGNVGREDGVKDVGSCGSAKHPNGVDVGEGVLGDKTDGVEGMNGTAMGTEPKVLSA